MLVVPLSLLPIDVDKLSFIEISDVVVITDLSLIVVIFLSFTTVERVESEFSIVGVEENAVGGIRVDGEKLEADGNAFLVVCEVNFSEVEAKTGETLGVSSNFLTVAGVPWITVE